MQGDSIRQMKNDARNGTKWSHFQERYLPLLWQSEESPAFDVSAFSFFSPGWQNPGHLSQCLFRNLQHLPPFSQWCHSRKWFTHSKIQYFITRFFPSISIWTQCPRCPSGNLMNFSRYSTKSVYESWKHAWYVSGESWKNYCQNLKYVEVVTLVQD